MKTFKSLLVVIFVFILSSNLISQVIDTVFTVHGRNNCVSATDTMYRDFINAKTGIDIYSYQLIPDTLYTATLSGQAYISASGIFDGVVIAFAEIDSLGNNTNVSMMMQKSDTISFRTISNANHNYFNVFLFDPGNVNNNHGEFLLRLSLATSLSNIEKKNNPYKIKDFKLNQNYPNPFNPITKIKYEISKNDNVKIQIFNSLGQKVRTLLNKVQITGTYEISWDATDDFGNKVGSGSYFYQIQVGDQVQTRRMIYLK